MREEGKLERSIIEFPTMSQMNRTLTSFAYFYDVSFAIGISTFLMSQITDTNSLIYSGSLSAISILGRSITEFASRNIYK